MQKSIFSPNYMAFVAYLQQKRKEHGLSQVQMARRLGKAQGFVSKSECGERRMDVIELREFCQAMGMSLEEFVRGLEVVLAATTGDG